MRKTLLRTCFAWFGVVLFLSICVSCDSNPFGADCDRFCTENNSIISSSGEFVAEHKDVPSEFGFRIRILDKSGNNIYVCDSLFLNRFSNFILWADDEDVLWGYNGDTGIYCWAFEDGRWKKYTALGEWALDGHFLQRGPFYYIDLQELSRTFHVPQALANIRPDSFLEETCTFYALPKDYIITTLPRGTQQHIP